MRENKKVPLFKYDARLEVAAQTHANDLQKGAAPHSRLQERIKNSGFPISYTDCLISRRAMQANYTEGIVWTPKGVPVDEKSMEYLTSSGEGEAHHDDFFDKKITHVGIGVIDDDIKVVVLDYGRICGVQPQPNPPSPPVSPQLTEEDFRMI